MSEIKRQVIYLALGISLAFEVRDLSFHSVLAPHNVQHST